MMTIVVANFLPNAFSNDQAEQLKEKIVEALKTDDKIINLNELGQSTYNHSCNNCIRDEKNGDSDIRLKIEDIIKNVDDI